MASDLGGGSSIRKIDAETNSMYRAARYVDKNYYDPNLETFDQRLGRPAPPDAFAHTAAQARTDYPWQVVFPAPTICEHPPMSEWVGFRLHERQPC